ncbi:MAG: carbamoyltransferase HypF [Deltaproteobacteria bacterium]|jgi:hydrogenase maturation protein HypF|nr:carbamoyltransferase HypF [Deltaproteobacteria bacterium]
MRRKGFSVAGRVQGVGFRPFVFRLAERFGLSGLVRNAPEGVLIEVQGQEESLRDFGAALLEELPPLAGISSCREYDLTPLEGEEAFSILDSRPGAAHSVLISPDMSTCPDCLRDMLEPLNRRFRHPFVNCTACGPRYSITARLPYDREQTSMSCFPLCPECAREYGDPRDRRFHAQPNACPVCGPRLWLSLPFSGEALPGGESFAPPAGFPQGDAALRELAGRIMSGQIAAVKGLGGFHLVCDALNEAALERLRCLKNRPHKPLALMLADAEAAGRLARIGAAEKRLLESPERPIVLCPRREGSPLPASLAPDTHYLGLMLPYTPLHHLLLRDCGELRRDGFPAVLVMTSGNREGEPIALGNREALERLSGLADCFLLHNRDILIRVDDSVLRPIPEASPEEEGVMFLRRARGFVPLPLPLPASAPEKACILGLGSELKNTVCLSRGREAFVSQHIGDLRNFRVSAFQKEISAHLAGVLQVEPLAAVADAHPDFMRQIPEELPCYALQHHFAHAEAVLAENGHSGPALVLALDGAGFAPESMNPDKSLWGGELIFIHPARHELRRLGSLARIPLPGGEAAVREPWRIAHAWLYELDLLREYSLLPWLPRNRLTAALLPGLLAAGLNTPRSSGAGRLFDAVSALLGLCLEISYEGQAAIRLEEAQHRDLSTVNDLRALYADYRQGRLRFLPCPVRENSAGREPRFLLDTAELFRALFARRAEEDAACLARAFHWSLAEGLADFALAGSRATGAGVVGLSGGVMQNLSLHVLLREKLAGRGLIPLTHRALPPGDACIAYGQTVWGAREYGRSPPAVAEAG